MDSFTMNIYENASYNAREIALKRAQSIENFVAVYIRDHPELTIDDIELIEKRVSIHESSIEFIWQCRPKAQKESERIEMPKPEYQIIDEDTQKGYPPFVIKKVLIDKIEQTYNVHKLAELVSVLFDTEPDIVRWIDDDELALALPKDDDEIQKHLAGMAISKL